MRHHYDLTDETRKVMSGNVSRIAEEANVSDKYIHGILAGTETDPFAPFEHYYAASVRVGAAVSHYDNKLAAIRARYEKAKPKKPVVECLTDQLNDGAQLATNLIEALHDGEIDMREAETIQPIIDKARSTLDLLETHLQFRRDLKVVNR
jgi:hypothetical protein